jgi:hypothetical protein
MAETPDEHVVVALATYFTGELTVELLAGLVTVTVASAGAAAVNSSGIKKSGIFMLAFCSLRV